MKASSKATEKQARKTSKSKKASFRKRLAAYSAMAAATTAVSAPKSTLAETVTHNFEPAININPDLDEIGVLFIDIDLVGGNMVTTLTSTFTNNGSLTGSLPGADLLMGAVRANDISYILAVNSGESGGVGPFIEGTDNKLQRLGPGFSVGGDGTQFYNSGFINVRDSMVSSGDWKLGDRGFFGFSFTSGTGTEPDIHYGWVDVELGSLTVRRIGFETVAGDPALTPAVPLPSGLGLGLLGLGAAGVIAYRMRRKIEAEAT